MPNPQKELQVAAICNGTVIDHIPPQQVFKVAALLHLDALSTPVTIGNNLESKKIGVKGIIKIADRFFEENEISKIALLVPNAQLIVIRNYEVVEKKRLALPPTLLNIVRCNNPKCITNNEPMPTCFDVMNSLPLALQCRYCNMKIDNQSIELK